MERLKNKVRTSLSADAIPDARTILSDDQMRDLRLTLLMHDISRARRRAFDEVMKPYGITRSQWWVIGHLSRHDGMMQTEVAAKLDIGKASLGSLVHRLEEHGFIERRPDDTDSRAKRVFMTKKAKQTVAKILTAELDFNEVILRDLSSKDRKELARMLSAVKKALDRLPSSRQT